MLSEQNVSLSFFLFLFYLFYLSISNVFIHRNDEAYIQESSDWESRVSKAIQNSLLFPSWRSILAIHYWKYLIIAIVSKENFYIMLTPKTKCCIASFVHRYIKCIYVHQVQHLVYLCLHECDYWFMCALKLFANSL